MKSAKDAFGMTYGMAKNKVQLKLWSLDYAKGYLYCYLTEILKVSDDEYDEYANRIDTLTI